MGPTKTEVTKCVKLWASVVQARKDNAPIPTQMRLRDRFFAAYSKLADKYGFSVTPDEETMNGFERRANALLAKTSMTGAGKDY